MTISDANFGLDFNTTTAKFIENTYNWADIKTIFFQLFSPDNNEYKDIYQYFLFFIVQLFTDNYHYVWAIGAVVYAYFFLKSLSFIITDTNFDNKYYCLILILMFTIPASIFNLTGLRFWTAGWIAIYSLLQIFVAKKKRYYLFILLLPFIHSGYYILWGLLFVNLLLRHKKLPYIFYFASIPFTFLNGLSSIAGLIPSLDILPSGMQILAEGYLTEETFNIYNDAGSGWRWVQTCFDFSLAIFYIILMINLYKKRHLFISDEEVKPIFRFLFLLAAFGNFGLILPYVGIRYRYLAWILLAYVLFSKSNLFKLQLVKFYPLFAFYEFYNFTVKTLRCINPEFLYRDLISLIFFQD